MSLELQSLLPYPNSCLGASPHQQGRDTKMLSFCGIDVSKDRLDVMVLPEEQCCSVPNDTGGWGHAPRAAAKLLDRGNRARGERRLRAWGCTSGAGKRPAMSTSNCAKM